MRERMRRTPRVASQTEHGHLFAASQGRVKEDEDEYSRIANRESLIANLDL
jgi:hypothetical protein